jgi:hypothetical protein
MPVEIRELVIRAVIVDDQSGGDGEGDSSSDSSKDNKDIIQECVNQVLKILKKDKNR